MKKFTKTILILCSVFLILGIILCGAGWCMGYVPGAYLRRYQQQIADGSIDLDYKKTWKNIDEIELSVGAADCRIETWAGSQIRVEAAEDDMLECKTSGSKLKVQYGDKASGISWLMQNNPGVIRIYVPEKLTLKKLDIEGGAAQITMQGLSCEVLRLAGGAGSFTYSGTIQEKADVECGLGEVLLQVAGSAGDFEYSFECGLGSISVENGPSIYMAGEYNTYGDAEKKMNLECGLGSINVNFYAMP